MHRFTLPLVVFVSGAVVMAYEITGSRVVAPYFGSSTIVWTALIGIILGALSLGYWLGGRLADRAPEAKGLVVVLLVAAAGIVSTVFFDEMLLTRLAGLEQFRTGVVIAAVTLFAPASVALGMVSPYAARLALEDIEHAGAVVGRLYAVSTFGSIAGTFLAGFWLLPLMGNTALLFALAAAEVFAALLLLPSLRIRAALAAVLLALLASSSAALADATLEDGDGIDIDTQYSRVRVFEDTDWYTGRPVLRMNINDGYSSAMFTDTDDATDLVYPYTKFYRLANHFAGDIRRVLMVGGAAYSYPKAFLSEHPDATIDVVEIDPGVTELAHTYFNLPRDHVRLNIIHQDARTFLNQAPDGHYDAVLMDAFSSNAVPYQLASLEAAEAARRTLREGGVLVANVISPINGEEGTFFRALHATYTEAFSQVEVFPVSKRYDPKIVGNVMMVAFTGGGEPKFSSEDEEINAQLSNVWRQPVSRDVEPLTDERNPADYYSAAYLGSLRR